jgi:hypothetical protein
MPRWMILTYAPTHIYKLWSCPWMGSLHLNKIEYTVHKDVFIQVETLYDITLLCQRNNGSNTGKKARRKNLRQLRERFLVSKSFPRVSKIFLSCPLTSVWFFFSLIFYWKYSIFLHETPHHTWNMTWHIFWRQRYGKGHLEIRKNENKRHKYI